MKILFLMLAAHALCDYPLQGDFLARGKNHRNPIPGVPWYQCLTAHALIHGGAVYLITGNMFLGLAEFSLHWVTDFRKSEGLMGEGELAFNAEQAVHVFAKIVWATTFYFCGGNP